MCDNCRSNHDKAFYDGMSHALAIVKATDAADQTRANPSQFAASKRRIVRVLDAAVKRNSAVVGQPHVELVELRKQRKAALDLCDVADLSDVRFAANIRAALGVCVACGCDLGTTPLCPSCEQSIEASKRERP